jgi:hypothetical protein
VSILQFLRKLWLAKRRCPGQRILLLVPRPEVTLVTDLEMAPAVTMKKEGSWIRMSLGGVMTLGPRPLLSAEPTVGSSGLLYRRLCVRAR